MLRDALSLQDRVADSVEMIIKRTSSLSLCPLRLFPTADHFNGLQSLSQRRETEPTATTTTTPPPVPHQPETEAVPLSSFDPDEEYISPSLYNPHVGPSYLTDDDHDHHEHEDVENCVLSEWGPWSPCTHSCGPEALQQRSRLVVMEARNGGTPCGDTRQRRYCTLPPCPRPRPERCVETLWQAEPVSSRTVLRQSPGPQAGPRPHCHTLSPP
ncbi:Spondin-1 [Portunus trituberculatus]|uniref:Spondin-1 n=1 Tax=Portunus trituberculatus TaxID=210409 RepID=A0A5B7FYR0_PORTR|nr:Spondin-1 [Portunus trituberculatus]